MVRSAFSHLSSTKVCMYLRAHEHIDASSLQNMILTKPDDTKLITSQSKTVFLNKLERIYGFLLFCVKYQNVSSSVPFVLL